MLTGSYKNNFHIFDKNGKTHTIIEATRTPKKRKSSLLSRANNVVAAAVSKQTPAKKKDEAFEPQDFQKKVLHMTSHPQENTIAVAAVNSLYIFSAVPQ